MGLRILPFRQYDENNVVNMFSFATGNANGNLSKLDDANSTAKAHAGVFVKVASADLNKVRSSTLIAATWVKHPTHTWVEMLILRFRKWSSPELSDSLSITLYQTALKDENDESFSTILKKPLRTSSSSRTGPCNKGYFSLHSAIANNTWSQALAN